MRTQPGGSPRQRARLAISALVVSALLLGGLVAARSLLADGSNPPLGDPSVAPSGLPVSAVRGIGAAGFKYSRTEDPVYNSWSQSPSDYPLSENDAFLVGGMEAARAAQFETMQLGMRDGTNVSLLGSGPHDRSAFAFMLPYFTDRGKERYQAAVNSALAGDGKAAEKVKSLVPFDVAQPGTTFGDQGELGLPQVQMAQPSGQVDQSTEVNRLLMFGSVSSQFRATTASGERILALFVRDFSLYLVPAPDGYTVRGVPVPWLIDDWSGSVSYGPSAPDPQVPDATPAPQASLPSSILR